ncbi:MAG: aminotransferase class I/II-fold pyridoxal phosphate-dependent enzyme, partial [Vicinamibacterales bacterium]
MNLPAPYMRWAKSRPHVTYDLASSGLVPVTTEELLGDAAAKDAFALSGSSDEGLTPLRDAIATRYGVAIDRVAIAAGASGANFQALLALLEPGDDVLIETPGYDPLVAA